MERVTGHVEHQGNEENEAGKPRERRSVELGAAERGTLYMLDGVRYR